uniref:Uncharacterized protein n=1 Tax=Astyanax mexicanus TaxID=7994 RepID=W5KC96_ASTMX
NFSLKIAEVIKGKNVLYIIDYYDRPGKASAEGPYAEAGAYACAFEDKPGNRVPKAGVFAEAGVGRARAEWRVCEAEAKGPNASAGVHADILGVEAEAAASLGQAQAQFCILEAEVKGPNASAGAYATVFGVEAKVLGCGLSLGGKTSVSLLGSELSINLW